ncbi:tripartite tricarboxylate transporter substrate binding protein [Rubrivivax gelatinosus]|uniref:tripartite tricarboxylate transporter substrate binding protein n=1 Tax=Rubrivivax gelatinosus TaxID=28068 RepID=UPI0002FE95F0|nr:tripartite tricarboxylate transporter substrate binding protein [Rubrivivax gelatinosus]MBG6082888.1 tripartite-type tricarboxylate transporter receptor subunit TctC [Rubrivivax gelatinosus]
MTRITRRTWIAAAALAAAGAALPALAQPAYPNKPIKLVVGYAAGGATDVIARLVGQKLGDSLGQTVVIDNRAGANSNVGAEAVARSPADGYTLYVYTIANTINATLYPKLGYDPEKDFEPIGLIAKVPNILVVNKDVPVKTLAEYVAYAKAQPQGVTFASSGSGSSIHLSGEMFKMMTKLNMLHVPYRGSAPAVSDLLGGQVQSMFDNAPSAMPHIQSGRLRPIAITSPQRSPLLPDVPTFIESGYADFDVQSWFGLAAPAGTPAAVVNKLNAELAKVLALPEVKKRLAEMGATPAGGSPADMRKFAAAEIKRWNAVVKASGAKAD